MPLPFVLLAGAAAAGIAGVANGAKGAQKMVESNDEKKYVESLHEANTNYYEQTFKVATKAMDSLGEFEVMIMSEFKDFSDVIEKIENRPEFGEIIPDGSDLPQYTAEDIDQAAVGAIALASGIGGATMGTFGGIAAASGVYAAVMTLGTASTGTAIASLSGAAATNATLAALGGGALAFGGGGMALGATVLGVSTLGMGLMIGGVIFNISGNTLKQKMEEAKESVETETNEIDKVCLYLQELYRAAKNYKNALAVTKRIYDKHFARLQYTVEVEEKTDYREFTDADKLAYKNTVLLVGVLYDMLKVKVVRKKDENYNEVNVEDLDSGIKISREYLSEDKLIKDEMLSVLNARILDELPNEALPEKEVVVKEESSAAQNMRIASENMKEISDKVGKGIKDVAGSIVSNTTCSKCGAIVMPGTRFCGKCGSAIK